RGEIWLFRRKTGGNARRPCPRRMLPPGHPFGLSEQATGVAVPDAHACPAVAIKDAACRGALPRVGSFSASAGYCLGRAAGPWRQRRSVLATRSLRVVVVAGDPLGAATSRHDYRV